MGTQSRPNARDEQADHKCAENKNMLLLLPLGARIRTLPFVPEESRQVYVGILTTSLLVPLTHTDPSVTALTHSPHSGRPGQLMRLTVSLAKGACLEHTASCWPGGIESSVVLPVSVIHLPEAQGIVLFETQSLYIVVGVLKFIM